jgi:hypothetical protein
MSQPRLPGAGGSAPACVEIHRLLSSGMLSRLLDSCRSLHLTDSQTFASMNSMNYGQVSHAHLAHRHARSQSLTNSSAVLSSGIQQLLLAGGGG